MLFLKLLLLFVSLIGESSITMYDQILRITKQIDSSKTIAQLQGTFDAQAHGRKLRFVVLLQLILNIRFTYSAIHTTNPQLDIYLKNVFQHRMLEYCVAFVARNVALGFHTMWRFGDQSLQALCGACCFAEDILYSTQMPCEYCVYVSVL